MEEAKLPHQAKFSQVASVNAACTTSLGHHSQAELLLPDVSTCHHSDIPVTDLSKQSPRREHSWKHHLHTYVWHLPPPFSVEPGSLHSTNATHNGTLRNDKCLLSSMPLVPQHSTHPFPICKSPHPPCMPCLPPQLGAFPVNTSSSESRMSGWHPLLSLFLALGSFLWV